MSNSKETHQIVTAIQRVDETLQGGLTATIAAGDIEIGAVELKNGTDDTRGTVKAASTAALATDTALVVALSPNNTPVGAGTAATALRVELPTDGTGLVTTKETPDATSTFTPSSDLSGALEASSISKATPGVFYGLSGYNSLASAQWILLYNTTTIPANGAVTPVIAIRVPATSNFTFDTGKFGVYFSTGICWSNSTDATIFNKTLGAADCFINLQYK